MLEDNAKNPALLLGGRASTLFSNFSITTLGEWDVESLSGSEQP